MQQKEVDAHHVKKEMSKTSSGTGHTSGYLNLLKPYAAKKQKMLMCL